MPERDAFAAFVVEASPRLVRTAYLLTGDRGAAEDLLQDVLAGLYVAWPRVADPLAYARRSLAHGAMSRWRRRARRTEVPWSTVHDRQVKDRADSTAERDRLVQALAQLPQRQRAVVVLRFFEDQSETQTARALGCSTGTVKSHTSRALARLRTLLREEPVLRKTP